MFLPLMADWNRQSYNRGKFAAGGSMAAARSGEAESHASGDWTDFARTGPGTLAGRYLRRFWQPVQRAEDLPAGRAKPIRIMSEDLTLYQGEAPGARPHPIRSKLTT
jgi:hypothetical protein